MKILLILAFVVNMYASKDIDAYCKLKQTDIYNQSVKFEKNADKMSKTNVLKTINSLETKIREYEGWCCYDLQCTQGNLQALYELEQIKQVVQQ